nr:MAG TPA: hypothetical protein [Caudoviricetes sp.]
MTTINQKLFTQELIEDEINTLFKLINEEHERIREREEKNQKSAERITHYYKIIDSDINKLIR